MIEILLEGERWRDLTSLFSSKILLNKEVKELKLDPERYKYFVKRGEGEAPKYVIYRVRKR